MPIYEYQAILPQDSCPNCRDGFEVIQDINDPQISGCPCCGNKVKKVISRCYAAVYEQSYEDKNTVNKIKEYEKSGMWSHAAELADKQSEITKDSNLKTRALDNYKKAGYDTDSLAKHVTFNKD